MNFAALSALIMSAAVLTTLVSLARTPLHPAGDADTPTRPEATVTNAASDHAVTAAAHTEF